MVTQLKNATNGKTLAWSITEDDLNDLETMRGDLLAKANQAQQNGRLFMATFYTQIAATVGPEVKRIRDRFDREALASARKELRALKLEARESERKQKEAEGKA